MLQSCALPLGSGVASSARSATLVASRSNLRASPILRQSVRVETENRRDLRASAGGKKGFRSSVEGLNGVESFDENSVSLLTFEEARTLVHKEGLMNLGEWEDWCVGGQKPKSIPSSPNRAYMDKGWNGWNDFLGITKDPLWMFWKASLEQQQPDMEAQAKDFRCNWLFLTTTKLNNQTNLGTQPVELAKRVASMAPLLGMDPYDALQVAISAPEVLRMTPDEVVASMVQLRASLPGEQDTTFFVARYPELLVKAVEMRTVAGECVSLLRGVLPEVCVVWLLKEEPWLLHSVPPSRLSELEEISAAHEHKLAEMQEMDEVHNPQNRQWFKRTFVGGD
mmetsp:Transcript_38586/g.83906  ORF Transcript_38586/g.83906 Transcript_38586/m.83906 type:complete len:337 (-) Transcript_38586:306-1316(-)|eukprot:CAMPEP_0118952256 /NCGR_PEP_ID=MMETSP1169-20130426/54542_1 /TAXON_ID=36882 /ORGANISM="Pyramimonas obovata, Strain CCMP722" /LENGTH=336 /DNA_ID=CAMNT_0006899463 /DNA_START=116 /DNA_END=1126 /DNA_ORIENTATION=+